MKKIALFSLFALAVCSCTPTGYVIRGHVADSSLVDHNVFLCDAFSDNNLDTAIVASDGTFLFKGSVGKEENGFLARINIEYSEAYSVLAVENGSIDIDFTYVDGAYIPIVGGTPMNDAIFALDNEFKQYQEVLVARLDSLDSDVTMSNEARSEQEYQYIEEFKKSYCNKCDEVFTANKDNVVGLFSILNWSSLDENLDVDSIASVAGEIISGNPLVQQMAAAKKMQKATQPGKPYTDLTGSDAFGNTVSLSDFVGKGKLVLVDFWASWCVPCKEEVPYIAAVAKKYDGKVTVVGLNVWDNIDEFNRVRKELKITWPQIVDVTTQSFTDSYGVTGIPQIILIGADGTILARDLRGESIAETIEKYL